MGFRVDKSYFEDNYDMSQNTIESILAEGEEILWQEKPKKSAFIWSRVMGMLPIALIWLLFDGFFIFAMVSTGVLSQMSGYLPVFIVFFALHLAPVWIWLFNIISGAIAHKNVHYVLTDKRLIVRSGVIANINIIDYSSITSVKCRVGLIDRMLKVGDIYISHDGMGKSRVVLFDVANPYKVTSSLQHIISDIKADIQFPNAMRPDSNEGYNTKYNGDNQL